MRGQDFHDLRSDEYPLSAAVMNTCLRCQWDLSHCQLEWSQKRPSKKTGLPSSPGGNKVTFPFSLPEWCQKGVSEDGQIK